MDGLPGRASISWSVRSDGAAHTAQETGNLPKVWREYIDGNGDFNELFLMHAANGRITVPHLVAWSSQTSPPVHNVACRT
jgi:hypothetical protein